VQCRLRPKAIVAKIRNKTAKWSSSDTFTAQQKPFCAFVYRKGTAAAKKRILFALPQLLRAWECCALVIRGLEVVFCEGVFYVWSFWSGKI
jgi:hypothetical protein